MAVYSYGKKPETQQGQVYCDRSYGTAIASSLDKLDITSIAETAAAYFYAIIAGVRNVKVPLRPC
ncbi:MAG: hypothetical protein ACYTXI_37020 [Nostoc sp.]